MQTLIFDLMDTVVEDPFLKIFPQYLGLTTKELFAIKNMDSWPAFELGEINEAEYFCNFFRPGVTHPAPDAEHLKSLIFAAYKYVPGMEELLSELYAKNISLWVHSNYTEWVCEIRERLQLDRFFSGYAISYLLKARKPDLIAYQKMLAMVGVPAQECIFIDDRVINVEAAQTAGLNGIQFIDCKNLRERLIEFNIDIER